MDLNTLIVAVFYEVDNWFAGQKKLRQRGPEPELSDSEVLTMEIVGEFLGIDAEKDLYAYFKRHYGEWFPALREVHRTTFTRQMANLWVAKERLWRHLLRRTGFDPRISVVDSFPGCPLAVSPAPTAAAFCPRSRPSATTRDGQADLLRAASAPAYLLARGVIVGVALVPADTHDLTVAEDLLEGAEGWAFGDRNYWSPKLTERLLGEEGLGFPR